MSFIHPTSPKPYNFPIFTESRTIPNHEFVDLNAFSYPSAQDVNHKLNHNSFHSTNHMIHPFLHSHHKKLHSKSQTHSNNQFPTLFRFAKPNSKPLISNNQIYQMKDDSLLTESLLSSFASISPPSYGTRNAARPTTFLTTASPLKFTLKDAIVRGNKREIGDSILRELVRNKSISHLKSSNISNSNVSLNLFRTNQNIPNLKNKNNATMPNFERLRFLDSGDRNINQLFLSLYKGPQFAPFPFAEIYGDAQSEISSDNLSGRFLSSTGLQSRHLKTSDEQLAMPKSPKGDPNVDFHSQLPLPQYPPLGDVNSRKSIIRFPDSEIIPFSQLPESQQAEFTDPIRRMETISSGREFTLPSQVRHRRKVKVQNYAKKPKANVRVFCPKCLKKSYTRRYISPYPHLRKSGAYIHFINVRPKSTFKKHRGRGYRRADRRRIHPLIAA